MFNIIGNIMDDIENLNGFSENNLIHFMDKFKNTKSNYKYHNNTVDADTYKIQALYNEYWRLMEEVGKGELYMGDLNKSFDEFVNNLR